MSMYVSFMIKVGDKFIRIADYSRNSQIYKIASDCLPYEKVRALNIHDLEIFANAARSTANKCKEQIEKINNLIKDISSFNNSVDEKLRAIAEYEGDKRDWEDDLDEINFAIDFFMFLERMIESVTYGENSKSIDADKYLYAGIEVGEPVEVEE